jgi:hypothetical protein
MGSAAAAVVAVLTCVTVANATQTITTPNAVNIAYNLMGGNSAAITPASNRAVLVMGCQTSGAQSVGQVSLLHITSPSHFITWVGLESFNGSGTGFTSGSSSTAGTHIVYIEHNHTVEIQVASANTIRVHSFAGGTIAGNVTLIW